MGISVKSYTVYFGNPVSAQMSFDVWEINSWDILTILTLHSQSVSNHKSSATKTVQFIIAYQTISSQLLRGCAPACRTRTQRGWIIWLKPWISLSVKPLTIWSWPHADKESNKSLLFSSSWISPIEKSSDAFSIISCNCCETTASNLHDTCAWLLDSAMFWQTKRKMTDL